jgi:hypothetical protein
MVNEKTFFTQRSKRRTFASVESFESVEAKKDFCLHLRHLCLVYQERLTKDRESWINKECDSRSWIDGEGLPSRE